jgi:hypothetical protein
MDRKEEIEFEIFNNLFSEVLLLWEEKREADNSDPAMPDKIPKSKHREVRQKISTILKHADTDVETHNVDSIRYQHVKFAISVFIDDVLSVHEDDETRFLFKLLQTIYPDMDYPTALNKTPDFYKRLQENINYSKFSVLELYMLCMLFGYRGRMNDEGCQTELKKIRNMLADRVDQRDIAPNWQTALAPHRDAEISLEAPPRWWKPKWWKSGSPTRSERKDS